MIDAESFYEHAFSQYEAGQLDAAIETFRILCTRDPLEGKFWFGLAATLQEKRTYDEAIQAWAVTAVLKTTDPYPHFHAAECYFSQRNLEDATLALDEAARRLGEDDPLQEKVAFLRDQWNIGRN